MGGGRAAGEEKVEQKEQQQCTQGRKVCLRIKLSERKTLGAASLLYIYICTHSSGKLEAYIILPSLLLIQSGRTTRTSPALFFILDRCKTTHRFILSRRRRE